LIRTYFKIKKRGLVASLFFVFILLLFSCARDEARSLFEKGESFRTSGAYVDAVKQYRKVVLHHEGSSLAPEALYRIGEINYLFLQAFSEAADAFNKLIAAYPISDRCPEAQRFLADIYMHKLGNRKQGIVEYQKAILYYGNSAEAEDFQYEIASAYFGLKNFQQQRLELKHILTTFPDTKRKGEIYFQIANSYYVEGRLDDAVNAFNKILKEFPDSPLTVESTFQLAVCLEEQEKLKKAISLLEEIEGIYPNPTIVERRIERIKKRLKKRRR
jgi:TolA-binding protein